VGRLDVELTLRDMVVSRAKAKVLIESGHVLVNGRCCQKCAFTVTDADVIQICGGESRFVSRGGYKLLKAMDTFSILLEHAVCMDVGASTGGFTDCMLQHGAAKVYAIDVGTDQLADVLRNDPRVISMEQVNFRYLTSREMPEPIDFSSVDVSFISLDKIFPSLFELLSQEGRAVCLIKPQFECGKESVGKNGVVRNPNVHLRVLYHILDLADQQGFSVLGLTYSPIRGPQGNIEYLIYLSKEKNKGLSVSPEETVKSAHQELGDID